MRETIHTWTLRLGAAACLLTACAPDSDPEVVDAYVPPVLVPDAGGPAPMQPIPDAAQPLDSGSPSVVPEAGATASDAGTTADAAPADATTPAAQTLLPFFPGATWTYRVTSATGTTMKVTTVGPEEAVGGTGPNAPKRAFKVTTTKGASDKTVSWQAVEGESVIRYREVSYAATTGMPELEEHWVPSKIHVHSSAMHRAASAKWSETYQETKAMVGMPVMMASVTDNWTVDAPKVPVTVPAGKFDAVVLIKSTASGSKTYWYVPGVGKVKETGGQTEELVSYDVTP